MIHTACPFFDSVREEQLSTEVSQYQLASQLLARAALGQKVERFVMTGSASSVIGTSDFTDDGIYSDAGKWTKCKFDQRPNEQAKFSAEQSAW